MTRETRTIYEAGPNPVADRPDRACRGEDLDLFFADGRGSTYRRGKAICRRCPALEDCYQWALPITDLVGVYGATTHDDRVRIRKRIGMRGWGRPRNAARVA